MPQNVLDKYRVIAQLGRGGMAEVYLATSSGPGGFSKLLVIKVLQEALARNEEFVRMFRDEARLAARLNHPNVVQTYEVGESEGRHFIAMEYLEGQPLNRVAEAFNARRSIDIPLVLRIGIDALAGLQYAHELRNFDGTPLGVVHRDITPQNIFVTYEGQVKLVDFGIAKAFDSTTETHVGTVKGKVAYMAPEQARGEPVGCTADIFSLGVILWELLAGGRLWEGLTDVAVIGRLVVGDIPDIRSLRPDLPPRLAGLVMRTLDPDPQGRPQTADALQRALEQELESQTERVTSRALGEVMRSEFQDERAKVRQVISKQLERLIRDTPSGVTPPGGWKLKRGGAGDMPLLGEGSSVHDAPTTIHTGETSSPPAVSLANARMTSDAETTAVGTHSRHVTWVALAAVGAAGLAIGAAQPWRSTQSWAPDPAASAESNPSATPVPVKASSPGAHTVLPHRVRCASENRPIVELTGEINSDARLTCDKEYLLRFTTFVSRGATLSIEPGTLIRGDFATKGTLVVQPGGRIYAQGTKDAPIVFSSASPTKKKPGDWGGVILLGEAPINLKDSDGNSIRGKIEGITSGGEYGGDNPNDSSGTLSYVRIEYSGIEIAPNNEINGLTFGGVGRGTVVDHVQIRHPADDCFEFFGGTVDAKYLVCQHADDDAFDWDYGYTGRMQFLVSQSHPKVSHDSHGLEGDNDPSGSTNTPISAPLIYNATLCGKNRRLDTEEHYGMLLRRGSSVRVRNGLFVGFNSGLDVRDAGTRPNLAASIFFQNVSNNLAFPETTTAPSHQKMLSDDDAGFDEIAYLSNPGLRIGQSDPKLGNCFDLGSPGFKPLHPLEQYAAIPPADGFFDTDARYVGAFRDRDDDWDAGGWLVWAEE